VGGAIINQEDDGSSIVAIGVKLVHHVKPNVTPHPSRLVVVVECACLLRSPMIPKASGLLRGANDGRFPKICTGGVDEDLGLEVILSLASLAPLLSLVVPTTLPDVANNLYNNPDSSKL
jgi:hypothetical protein